MDKYLEIADSQVEAETESNSSSILNSETVSKMNDSQNLFPESPVYEPEDFALDTDEQECINKESNEKEEDNGVSQAMKQHEYGDDINKGKRKLMDVKSDNSHKILKLDLDSKMNNEDFEVSAINSKAETKELLLEHPPISRVLTPIRSSPRKITKRSNSCTSCEQTAAPKTPRTPKTRSVSVDISKEPKILKKLVSNALPVSDVPATSKAKPDYAIEEMNDEHNDSQNIHLILSQSQDDDDDNSESILFKEKKGFVNSRKQSQTKTDECNSTNETTNNVINQDKDTAEDSTESVGSISIESPEPIPTVSYKIISKLSNGNSSTPTDRIPLKKHGVISVSDNESDTTPDPNKVHIQTRRIKNESFQISNSTTPSTISPLPNGHMMPNINTPNPPTFDVHINHSEDGEFLSLYIVRTDNDVGMDMCREYQRLSRRFTIDPYLADVSVNTSPSSVMSTGMINLPIRTSFVSTTSSSSSLSNRTSDGAFVVPPPPRKSVLHPGSSSVKGYEALMKKVQDIFSHLRDSTDDTNRSSSDVKVSKAVQVSPTSITNLSNGNASPGEVNRCDKITPKSSLKKNRVRGRRPLTGKTKRALLPTQLEEAEYMHGMNSPEIISSNGIKEETIKDEKTCENDLTATPKSISKLKQKRSRPISPRPATPVEKSSSKPEYSGYAPDTAVLAKWVDKRYYSGKVLEITEPNKYLIKFDDGHTKTLLDEFIIFGDMKTLPLQGQSLYCLVDEDQNYEPGLVLGIDENDSGTVTYRCTTDGDATVCVTASELYLTEDQARSIKEMCRDKSPSTPNTPRRRMHRELDLDNIIQGPRSARTRDKGNSSAKKRMNSPKSPKASTSGVKSKCMVASRKRLASESSEMSESSNSAPPTRLEEVAGVEPEIQRTPKKIDGVKAGPLQLKGAAKQNIGKKNSKLTKFENDEDTVSLLGPIPDADSKLFAGLHFLLTYTELPRKTKTEKETRHYSSEEDGETTSNMTGTDCEELEFTDRPFNKERLKEQLETGGGVVYSHFDDVPKNKYSICKLIAPRPCLTAKYIQCLAADIRCISHPWVIMSCIKKSLCNFDPFILPAGLSVQKQKFIDWPLSGKRNTSFFKDKIILLCGDQDTFVKFWERVCTLAGATTRVVNEEDLNMSGALALVTEWDCPHEVQNKANQDNIPLVSTAWVVQCLIESRVLPPTSHVKFSFMYAEPE